MPEPREAAGETAPASGETPALRRSLGLRDVVVFLVVAVISPRWLAQAAALGPAGLVVWCGALLAMFVPLSLAVAELSARYPDEGGIYVWTREAFGRKAAFVAGWSYWTCNLVYFPALLYFAAASALRAGPESLSRFASSPSYFVAFSLAGLALATAVNVVGLDVGKRLHDLGAIGTWIPLSILAALAAASAVRFGSATDWTAGWVPSVRFTDLIFWASVAFAFGGLEGASFLGGEIRDSRRTVPRAVALSGALVVLVYLAGTAAILVGLPAAEAGAVGGLPEALARMSDRLGVPAAGRVAAFFLALASVGGVGAWLAAPSRLPFVMGVDRLLPHRFTRLHPRFGTPAFALGVQGCAAGVFAVLGQAGTSVEGAYETLVSMGVVTYFIPFLFLFAAMFRVQRNAPPEGAFRVPGGAPAGRLLAAVGFVTTAASIVFALLPSPTDPHPARTFAKVAGAAAALQALGAVLLLRRPRGADGERAPNAS